MGLIPFVPLHESVPNPDLQLHFPIGGGGGGSNNKY